MVGRVWLLLENQEIFVGKAGGDFASRNFVMRQHRCVLGVELERHLLVEAGGLVEGVALAEGWTVEVQRHRKLLGIGIHDLVQAELVVDVDDTVIVVHGRLRYLLQATLLNVLLVFRLWPSIANLAQRTGKDLFERSKM